MPKTIEPNLLERPWHVPGAHQPWNRSAWTDDLDPEDGQPDHALTHEIHTEPGDLDDERRVVDSLGLWLVCGVIGAVGAVSMLAHYWPRIIAWGGW